jgi:hypothetical protein
MYTQIGMLFKQYKTHYCTFEILKLYFKLLIVLIIIFLEEYPTMMVVVINIVLSIYYAILVRCHPYIYHIP